MAYHDRWVTLAPMQAFGVLLGVEREHIQMDLEDGGFLSLEVAHVLAIAPVA